MDPLSPEILERFKNAVQELDRRYGADSIRIEDENVENELRAWLDADDEPLPWSDPKHVTADEWFFVTTLYGEMTLAGQRAHIRKFFKPLFVEAVKRDIRSFRPGLPQYAGLRSRWMAGRLTKMADVLRQRQLSMFEYANHLRELERHATPDDPTPALGAIIRDHQATGWKTLSVFVRDCVGGNCFPIDSRVGKALDQYDLPRDEQMLTRLALAIGRNPRPIARMFYEQGA